MILGCKLVVNTDSRFLGWWMPARGQLVLEAGNSLPASGHYGAYQDSIWRPWRECRGEAQQDRLAILSPVPDL